MATTFGQQFDKATGKNNDCHDAARRALILLAHRFVTFADVPNNDFNPQFKSSKDEARLEDTPQFPNRNVNRDERNNELMGSMDSIRQIRFLSLERHGVTHDFPLRLEFKQGLELDFTGISKVTRPVLVVTGLDGKEHAFTSKARYEGFNLKGRKGIDKAADFISGELKKKAVTARKSSPAAQQVCCG